MKAIIIYILFVCLLLSILFWVSYPDYGRRGQVVQIAGQSWGYLISEDKGFFPHKRVRVLYPTSTGQWVEQEFPIEIVKPMLIIKP